VIVTGDIIGEWVFERTGGVFEPKASSTLGWENEDGRLTAGVVFDQYNGRSLCMHVALERPLYRGFLRSCFRYAFDQLGVLKVIGLVDSKNEKALRLDRHLGFIEEAKIKDAGKTGDLIILTMTRPQCRWI
jgi:L-amino acid N-acyltransferase YncA